MNIEKYLLDINAPAVVRMTQGPLSVENIRRAAGGLKYFIADLDGCKMSGKKEMLEQFAEQLKFPEHFGFNLDALEECLRDLGDWIRARGYLIIVRRAESAAKGSRPSLKSSGSRSPSPEAEGIPEDFGVLLEILRTASGHWKKRNPGVPFKVILLAKDTECLKNNPEIF